MQKNGLKSKSCRWTNNQKGFTLIELISVLIIMGVMVSVGIKKFDLLSDNASIAVLTDGIRELNTREIMVWSKIKLSDDGYSDDTEIYNAIDKNIGPGYSWNPVPNISGGTLHFKSQSIDLTRIPSTTASPGAWKKI